MIPNAIVDVGDVTLKQVPGEESETATGDAACLPLGFRTHIGDLPHIFHMHLIVQIVRTVAKVPIPDSAKNSVSLQTNSFQTT